MEQDPRLELHFKIAISGAGETGHCGQGALDDAKQLGKEVAKHNNILVTGAGTGFPLWSVMGAEEVGGMTVGFSPAATSEEHTDVYRLPLDHLTMPIFTGFGHSGRDLLMVRSSDAVVFGCGQINTVNEFTIAYKENKPMGILRGDWSTDKLLEEIVEKANDEERDIIVDRDPKRLVEQLIKKIKEKRRVDNSM